MKTGNHVAPPFMTEAEERKKKREGGRKRKREKEVWICPYDDAGALS